MDRRRRVRAHPKPISDSLLHPHIFGPTLVTKVSGHELSYCKYNANRVHHSSPVLNMHMVYCTQ